MVTRLIEYHVVPGVRALSTQLVNGTMVPTALGATKTLTILVENGSVDVEAKGNTAKVVKADLQTCNGVIHAVDKVSLTAAVLRRAALSDPRPSRSCSHSSPRRKPSPPAR